MITLERDDDHVLVPDRVLGSVSLWHAAVDRIGTWIIHPFGDTPWGIVQPAG